MAFKQPRVPEYRENEGVAKHLRALTLFLKDFCQDVWTACRLTDKGLDGIKYPVTSVNKKTGDVVLSASDVGARASDWMPTAEQVGALASGGTAVNASKFNSKTWAQMLTTVYPVGAVYVSADSTSPASLFGGTWEQLKDRFLLGAGDTYDAGDTGGAAAVTLTIDQIPSHSHTLHSRSVYSGGGNYIAICNEANATGSYVSGSRGGGEAHNNMPPYVAVYMWKRVS